jgi:tetratricopeptide (TPR) repeat protein
LIRFLLALALAAGCLPAAELGQLDASPSLFSVLAAINAAGYDADLASGANHPLRERVRRELAGKNIPSLVDLKRFFSDHRQKDWTAELSQYVSFALSVDGPPSFSYRFMQNELPPDVAPLEGLPELMARFHREAGIDELWRQAQPELEAALGRYHEPVTRAVTEANAYLRYTSSGYLGRRFQILIDVLGAPNQIQIRSYKDDYFVVLTPSPEPQIEDVRHAYLHYLLDPIAMRSADKLDKKRALADYARGAPALEEYYKSDFLLLATESLIKAVESRLAPGPKKQALAEQALREGYILTPFFAEHLPYYEQQEVAMRLYFPEMIEAIDLKKEERRLEKVEFLSERPARKAKVVPAERKIEPSGPYKTAQEAEQLYAGRQLGQAKEAYLRLLKETEEKPLHAKAYYGLARIAVLEKDPETGEKLFLKTLESSPDPQTKAWSLVYLGRLADLAGEREQAAAHYRSALEINGASAGARKAAEQGLQEAFGPQKSK